MFCIDKGGIHLQLKLLQKGSTLLINIQGELDHHSAEYLRRKIDGEMMKSSTKYIILDLSGVSFMDSSGIGVIIGRYKNITKLNGKLAVINAGTHIRKIFEMSGLLRLIPLYDNIDDAMEHFNAS